MGGSSDPSVLRSPGATPQKGRAAHGPRHPAVIIPLRLCLLDVCLLLGVSWVLERERYIYIYIREIETPREVYKRRRKIDNVRGEQSRRPKDMQEHRQRQETQRSDHAHMCIYFFACVCIAIPSTSEPLGESIKVSIKQGQTEKHG